MDPVADFAARFTWARSGLRGLRILRQPGPVQGDCKAFALTVAWLLAGQSLPRMAWHMATFRTVMWLVWSTGGALHVTTWHRSRGWICNVYPDWRPATPHRRLFPGRALIAPLILAASGPWF